MKSKDLGKVKNVWRPMTRAASFFLFISISSMTDCARSAIDCEVEADRLLEDGRDFFSEGSSSLFTSSKLFGLNSWKENWIKKLISFWVLWLRGSLQFAVPGAARHGYLRRAGLKQLVLKYKFCVKMWIYPAGMEEFDKEVWFNRLVQRIIRRLKE